MKQRFFIFAFRTFYFRWCCCNKYVLALRDHVILYNDIPGSCMFQRLLDFIHTLEVLFLIRWSTQNWKHFVLSLRPFLLKRGVVIDLRSRFCRLSKVASLRFFWSSDVSGCLTDQQVWFPGVSGRHSDENSVKFEVFEMGNFNLNEEEYGDRPHPTPITVIRPSLTLWGCRFFRAGVRCLKSSNVQVGKDSAFLD